MLRCIELCVEGRALLTADALPGLGGSRAQAEHRLLLGGAVNLELDLEFLQKTMSSTQTPVKDRRMTQIVLQRVSSREGHRSCGRRGCG